MPPPGTPGTPTPPSQPSGPLSAADLQRQFKDFFDSQTTGLDLQVKAFKNYGDAITPTISNIGNGMMEVVKTMLDYDTALKFTEKESVNIQKAFGVSKTSIDDFKTAIANAAPELLQMGVDADETSKIIVDVGNAFGNTGVIGKEAITELAAANKITGQSVKDLATNFRNVGVSIYDVGDAMKEVANYAKSVGVSVQAVSAGVVTNLEKMNLFNFEGGIKGLTKMAAQAARLGFDMSETFKVADKVFNPEGAIELAAGLQRLGVASNDLLDPLRAMDLAQNDPEELQNQIVDLTKTFTKFNQDTGKFEILPGEKRRIREIAQEMGILPEKLAEMSIKASEFDRKMKSIEFPTAKKEDQELIASLAQISGGTAVIEVKDAAGKRSMKEVRQLSPEDIDRLKEQQADASKSIEELAMDQLDSLENLNATASAIAAKVTLGYTTSSESLRIQKTGNQLTKTLFEQTNKQFETQDVRTAMGKIVSPVEETIVKASRGEATIEDVGNAIKGIPQSLTNMGSDFVKNATIIAQNSAIDTHKKIIEIYKEVGNPQNKNGANSSLDLNVNIDATSNAFKLDANAITQAVIGLLQSNSQVASQFGNALNINYLNP